MRTIEAVISEIKRNVPSEDIPLASIWLAPALAEIQEIHTNEEQAKYHALCDVIMSEFGVEPAKAYEVIDKAWHIAGQEIGSGCKIAEDNNMPDNTPTYKEDLDLTHDDILQEKNAGRPSITHPDSQTLLAMYKTCTRKQLAKKYGASIATVSKWISDARKELQNSKEQVSK